MEQSREFKSKTILRKISNLTSGWFEYESEETQCNYM